MPTLQLQLARSTNMLGQTVGVDLHVTDDYTVVSVFLSAHKKCVSTMLQPHEWAELVKAINAADAELKKLAAAGSMRVGLDGIRGN